MSVIEVKLSIVDGSSTQVGQGYRRTRDEHYYYRFDPEIVHVTEHDTIVIYHLVSEDANRYTITNLYATPNTQLSTPEILAKGTAISVVHSNTQQCLLDILVTVADRQQQGRRVSCDPQMSNDPPPGGCE